VEQQHLDKNCISGINEVTTSYTYNKSISWDTLKRRALGKRDYSLEDNIKIVLKE
jgi:hypothetical protein